MYKNRAVVITSYIAPVWRRARRLEAGLQRHNATTQNTVSLKFALGQFQWPGWPQLVHSGLVQLALTQREASAIWNIWPSFWRDRIFRKIGNEGFTVYPHKRDKHATPTSPLMYSRSRAIFICNPSLSRSHGTRIPAVHPYLPTVRANVIIKLTIIIRSDHTVGNGE